MKDASTSLVKGKYIQKTELSSSEELSQGSSSEITVLPLDSSFHVDSMSETSSVAEEMNQSNVLKLKFQIDEMNSHPRMYLGIDPENIFIVDRLTLFLKASRADVMTVLRKIRLNESMERLGHVFCVSRSTISRRLHKNIPNMAQFLKSLIIWPERSIIYANLPLAFRANFNNVQSIIDCFEVEIEKPSKPTHQALTWSEYKKCNTVKYLISCTPDGNINFISNGYGGRTSDSKIIQECGYLDKLKPGTVVMADRGFKAVETILSEKRCSLLRPPSVATGSKMTEAEVRYTKLIASLRVHVERVIKRVREYHFLEAHSCFHHDLLALVDQIVIIACALSNLQGPLLH
uniref:DDE Tnp4 domain-containing protein n=1 Tax=Cacopsylla melanoneura TaxID=428564 RepID=A0A8D8W0D6_9HEMI